MLDEAGSRVNWHSALIPVEAELEKSKVPCWEGPGVLARASSKDRLPGEQNLSGSQSKWGLRVAIIKLPPQRYLCMCIYVCVCVGQGWFI